MLLFHNIYPRTEIEAAGLFGPVCLVDMVFRFSSRPPLTRLCLAGGDTSSIRVGNSHVSSIQHMTLSKTAHSNSRGKTGV